MNILFLDGGDLLADPFTNPTSGLNEQLVEDGGNFYNKKRIHGVWGPHEISHFLDLGFETIIRSDVLNLANFMQGPQPYTALQLCSKSRRRGAVINLFFIVPSRTNCCPLVSEP